jgi:hypothetical protein
MENMCVSLLQNYPADKQHQSVESALVAGPKSLSRFSRQLEANSSPTLDHPPDSGSVRVGNKKMLTVLIAAHAK